MKLQVNGMARAVESDSGTPLLYVLRGELKLKGTRFGCGAGQCGACTVLVDGRPQQSCSTPLWSVQDKAVTTIEGLGTRDVLGTLQRAFLQFQAAQCGFCTSGIIMTAEGLLRSNQCPTDDDIREALSRNLCRCGAHVRILAAIRHAASERVGVR